MRVDAEVASTDDLFDLFERDRYGRETSSEPWSVVRSPSLGSTFGTFGIRGTLAPCIPHQPHSHVIRRALRSGCELPRGRDPEKSNLGGLENQMRCRSEQDHANC